MSYTIGAPPNDPTAAAAMTEFIAVTDEMAAYVNGQLAERRAAKVRDGDGEDDLLTRLAAAEVDGERLSPADILGFFQLLLLAGSETTTNLISNAVLCFDEHPDQLALVRARRELIPSAVEEVLRYRSPLQWTFRVTRRDVSVADITNRPGDDRVIPARQMVIAVFGSANRDPRAFASPERFDVTRDPNPHVAFGHGVHFCLGAALARLEGRIALGDLLDRLPNLRRASAEPWEPRAALHVHGPNRLPVRFEK
jgi:cytochrome P450